MDWIIIVCVAILLFIAFIFLLYWLVSLTTRSWDKAEKKSHDEFEADWNKFMRKK